jgi:uncharacterized membrane protein YedE/YeeE
MITVPLPIHCLKPLQVTLCMQKIEWGIPQYSLAAMAIGIAVGLGLLFVWARRNQSSNRSISQLAVVSALFAITSAPTVDHFPGCSVGTNDYLPASIHLLAVFTSPALHKYFWGNPFLARISYYSISITWAVTFGIGWVFAHRCHKSASGKTSK